jgi:hypothetical protein
MPDRTRSLRASVNERLGRLGRTREAVGNDRPGALYALIASLSAEVRLQRRGLLGGPGDLLTMQDAEVDVAQLADGCSQSVGESCRGERVSAGGVSSIERDAVVLANRAQGPFASPEAVELFVEHVRIDNEHPIQAADAIQERPTSMPVSFAIQNSQVKARSVVMPCTELAPAGISMPGSTSHERCSAG